MNTISLLCCGMQYTKFNIRFFFVWMIVYVGSILFLFIKIDYFCVYAIVSGMLHSSYIKKNYNIKCI